MCATLVFSSLAYAAEKKPAKTDKCYRVIVGQEHEMCRLYEQNLNRFCNEPPMVCDRKIHPDFAKYFSLPKWEDVDPMKHLDIIESYIRESVYGYTGCVEGDRKYEDGWAEKKWQKYKIGFFEQLKKGNVKLSRARFNIKGSGKEKQIVYRLKDFTCAINDEFWNDPMIPQNIVIDEKTGKLDRNTMAIIRYGSPKEVFFYEGYARLSTWDMFPDRVLIDQASYEQCEIEYIGNKGGKAK
jgi:hypothetical protein